MYMIKIHSQESQAGSLTYTFHNTSSGRSGNDFEGINTFISAFKKEYVGCLCRVALCVMRDDGAYYNEKTRLFSHNIENFEDFEIVLSEGVEGH